jgi:hypothetical protein
MNDVHGNSKVRNIEQADIRRAGEVLANAFCGYPNFSYCFGDEGAYQRLAPWMFAKFARWTMLYGKAWATLDLNAVALRHPPGTRNMGFWSIVRSGVLFPFMSMDIATRRRFDRVGPVAVKTRKKIMGDEPHWYCWMMGVKTDCQGKGAGKQLMQHTFEQSDRARLPCYLETFSESSVRIHEGQLYSVRDAIRIPETPLTLYAMVRPPQ